MNKINSLVVEDDPICQYVMSRYMKKLACNIDIAGDYEDAYSLLQTKSFDIIFMDIGLPGTDGITLASNIRHDLQITCPIIAVTGHVLDEDKKLCLNSGMDGVLHKPISKESLLNIFKEYNICGA